MTIIVTARPNIVVSGQFYSLFNFPDPGGPGGWSDPVNVSIAADVRFSQLEVFEKEDDVDDDIVVIGTRIVAAMRPIFITSVFARNGSVFLPCVGETNVSEILNIMENMKFNATNKNFGPNRAGENIAEPINSSFTINVNAEALKGYDQLGLGLEYLIFHEIAHGLVSGQQYNNQQWLSYINGPGKGLTLEQQIAGYADSAQFEQNEAFANSIARGLLKRLTTEDDFEFEPTNGYATC